MQIQPILDIKESTWELSPEAQTHNKLLHTGTILLVSCFFQLISNSWGFGGGWGGVGLFVTAGEKNEEKRMLCKNKNCFTSFSFRIVASFENVGAVL